MSLDPRTILLLTSLSTLLVGLAMFAAAGFYDNHVPGVRQWAWACVTLSVVWALSGARDHISDFVSIVLANCLLIVALALFLRSLKEFIGAKEGTRAKVLPYCLVLPVFGLFLYFTYVAPSMAARIVVISVAAPPLLLACAATLLRQRQRQWSFGYWITAGGFVLCGVASLFRAVVVLIRGQSDPNLFSSDLLQMGSFLFLYCLIIVLTFGFTLMCSDRFNAELRRLAMSDPVTGCLNRSAIEHLAAKELNRTLRTRSPLSLLLLDLDYFKSVNDTYGHLVGDQVLRGFAASVSQQLRAYDLIGRFGGEEFVVLLPNTATENALQIAERMRSLVEQSQFVPEQESLRCTVSIGLATLASEDETYTSLLQRADTALYAAKSEGRNRCRPSPL